MEKMNVLIVDDDKNLCKCLVKLLPWEEMECDAPQVAYNGQHAWDIMQSSKIDLVISDLKMPVMDGMELCRIIREKFTDIIIVFLSAYEDFSIAQKAMRYGVTDYILKPINMEGIESLKKINGRAASEKGIQEWNKQLFSREYSDKIREALKGQNITFFEELFQNLRRADKVSSLNACMYLLRILNEHHQSTDREKADSLTLSGSVYEKKCRDLLAMNTAAERIQYVQQQYEKVLQDVGDESRNAYIVHQAKALIEENYFLPECNVTWISGKLYMQPAYVGRLFSKKTGIGLAEYIVECRMKQASLLLRESNVPVNEIASKVGYSYSNYFTRAFRNRFGLSPSEYRQKHGKKIIDNEMSAG